MATKIEFNTTEFVLSHGRMPRGRGSWAFSEDRNPDPCGPDIIWSPSMTYGEAKRWLRNKLKADGVEGYHEVYVLP